MMKDNIKKILYVSFGDDSIPGRGVTKKIHNQLKAFEKAGMETVFVSGYRDCLSVYRGELRGDGPELVKLQGGIRKQLYGWIASHAEEFTGAYIRFQFFDYYLLKILKALKKADVKILMEFPTFPYVNELKSQGLRSVPKRIIDVLFRKSCCRRIDCFTCPSYDGQIFGREVLPMKNGIEIDGIPPRKPLADNNTIRLLAVASMSPWHGLERIIEGLRNYRQKGGARSIRLKLVGDGPELFRYKELAEKFDLRDAVEFAGRLSGEDLSRVYDWADIGICSLGIQKMNIKKTNTLKTLEYLSKGLPVVCEAGESAVEPDNKYRLNISSGSAPVDLEEIVDFYDRIYNGGRTAAEVADAIRGVCAEKCSAVTAMKAITQWLLK